MKARDNLYTRIQVFVFSRKQNGALKCVILEQPSESLVKWEENYFYISRVIIFFSLICFEI